METMEQEKLQPIDLEVLPKTNALKPLALAMGSMSTRTADEISKKLNIDYTYTLKIFKKLEKKGLCVQWVVNKKKEKETKNNFYKVCYLSNLVKDLCAYLNALKGSKTSKKDPQ